MKNPQSKEYLFEHMPVPGAVLQLSTPIVISSLVTILYNLADTFFVGMLNDPVQNAAVTLVYPVTLAFNAVNNLFGVGVSSAMSRNLGRKAYDEVRTCSAFGFYGALCSGLLFSALCLLFRTPLLTLLGTDAETLNATLGYMQWTVFCGALPAILNVVQSYMVRSEGSTLHASIGTMSGCLLNILLDPIFILPWGFNMGAAGAGLATFLSNCIACLYFLVLARIKKGSTFVSMNPRMLRRLTMSQVRDILGVGIPASIQNLLNVTGTTLLNNFTAPFGAAAIAAMGISQKLYMIPMQMSLGFSQGIMPLVSYNYASGNRARMKEAILFALRIIVGSMLFLTAVYFLGAPAMIRAFMDSDQIVGYGTRFLRVMSLGFVFLCTDFLAVGVFQALGMGRNALFFAICRKLVLEIPLLFLLNHFYPLYGLPFAQLITEVFLCALGLWMLRRIFRAEVH
ncbi:MATE family efflux transporter [Subdoligranulum variabile]|nr:MATE family efflux transporter [Subdoligranulum variabile]UWP67174.1 MATE family efflux transporter [Subdoligranulum variabile]